MKKCHSKVALHTMIIWIMALISAIMFSTSSSAPNNFQQVIQGKIHTNFVRYSRVQFNFQFLSSHS